MTREYDSGFLTAIPGYANSLTYHDNLALASVAHSNGVTDWVGQDPNRMMRPAALWTSGVAAGEDWNSGSYQFDGSGNIKAIGAQRFRYDAVSRLVEAKIWVPENNPPLNSFDDGFETGDACNWEVRNPESGCVAGAHQLGLETYTYDPYGNLIARTTETSDGATQINTPADPQTNRLQGASSYDAEGNMTGWNGAQYDFDALGQMVRMRNGNQDWLFAYSTGGERILQVAEGGLGKKRWTVRDAAGRVLREWVAPAQGTATWTRDWIYRGRQILATVEPQQQQLLDQAEGETSQVVLGAPLSGSVEVIRHLTLDHLGTPRLVTGEAGSSLAFHIYWPYGREASDPLQNELRKKFTGHERDSYDLTSLADELDYMHARFGSPTLGRFLSADPLGGAPARAQSFNRYSNVFGNPLRYLDPTGREGDCPEGTVCEVINVTGKKPPNLPPVWWWWYLDFDEDPASNISSKPEDGFTPSPRIDLEKPKPGPERKDEGNDPEEEEGCGGLTSGVQFEFSWINPFTSGQGGIIGINIQGLPNGTSAIYFYSTKPGSLKAGGGFGVTGSINFAYGSGHWGGETTVSNAGYAYGSVGVFGPPPGASDGYRGIELGGGWSTPSLTGTVQHFRPVLSTPVSIFSPRENPCL